MPTTLLAAKFLQPAPPRHAVPRPALVQRLNDGLAAGQPLLLIDAPAGYGKTTLAAEWAAHLESPVAWLALEEADDDPLRFCAYFLAALQRLVPTAGAELLPIVQAGQLPAPDLLTTTLLNDLAAARPPQPLLCVLDDFHAIQDPAILAFLQGLLAHQATGLHLALVTREDPALPLARLRARGQLTEIRAADLRFDAAETTALLRHGMGLALADRDLARLAERTEGWAAGLQLAGLSMQGHEDPAAFIATLSGSHRFILSYLTEEVLARQPADVGDFLLQSSILEQLSGELCDAVTGRSGSAALLERLLAANLFLMPLDDDQRWYRYHHLFAELLQAQLRRRYPGLIAELHQRASLWFEAHHLPAAAIGNALAAGNHSRVAALLERHAWTLLNTGYARRLEEWLKLLPADVISRSPRISLDFGWMRLLRGAPDQVGPLLAQVDGSLAGRDPAETAALQAERLALQANLQQLAGQAEAAIASAQSSLALSTPTDHRLIGLASLALGGAYRQTPDFARSVAALQAAISAARTAGDQVTEMLSLAHLTLMAVPYGRLRLAAQATEEALRRTEQQDAAPLSITGAVYGALGLIYYEWNDVDRAQEYLRRGIRLGVLSGHHASLIYNQSNLARLLQAQGDFAGARQALAEASILLAQGAPAWVRPELLAAQARLALAQGDVAAAEAHLRASGVASADPVTHRSDPLHLAWLRMLLMRKEAQANSLAQRIIDSAEAGDRRGVLVQALILAARLYAPRPAAAVYLERALALAKPEGFVRVFLDEGPAVAALLHQAGWPAWLPQPASAISPSPLRRWGQGGEVVEPLSERELQVLRLLAAGLTYAEIAGHLMVSLNTVRFHVKEIYGKLGVNRQAQAVARAREMGLL